MSRSFSQHVPVLLGAAINALRPIAGVWVDCTLGAGSYTRALLDHGARRVIGIDRDPAACSIAAANLADQRGLCTIVNDRFGSFDERPEVKSASPIAGVVFDLGVSSMQLRESERGFSIRLDGPLDMRMGPDGMTAAEFVNSASEGTLARVIREYGEERNARRIARQIVSERAQKPINTTGTLTALIEQCLSHHRPGPIHKATRTFQALRIHINDELGELRSGLESAARALAVDGKLAVVSFHSLEDKIVKSFLQPASRSNRHRPASRDAQPLMRAVGSLIRPDQEEIEQNPRSRSAKLRIGCKNAVEAAAGQSSCGSEQLENGI